MATTVNKKELISLLRLISKELSKSLPDELELDMDTYWYIPTSDWGTLNTQIEPALGMVSEDWEVLKTAIKKKDTFSFSMLDKTSFLLRAIRETLIPTK